MSNKRPSVFIGSSSEGTSIAEALQANLDDTCDIAIWNQGIFGLSEGTLESLAKELPTFDFAILALTSDDLSQVRGETKQSPRDNVLFEFGLCIGILGRERTFAVYDRASQPRIPSDLAGVTLAGYRLHQNGNLQASLGASSTKIKNAIKKLGPRTVVATEEPDSVFLAVPMNAFKVAGRSDDYNPFRKEMLQLVEVLINDCRKTVFCAIEDIQDVKEFDLPGASLAFDIDKVQEHEFFILIYMRDILSKSVLIEMGMALAMGKKCIICVQLGAELPFLLRDAASAVQNVKMINFETIDELIFEIKKNNSWIFNFEKKRGFTSRRKTILA